MNVLLFALVGVMLAAALALVLMPLGRPIRDPLAQERARLEAQRDDLYRQLRGLPDTEEGDVARLPLEARAARVLRRLDELPVAPPAADTQVRSARLSRLGWGAALALTLVAALGVLPPWQKLGVGEADAAQVTAAQRLPGLRAAARSQGTAAAYNAWGDAAFEQGTYGDALRAYTESLKLDPRQAQPLRRLGTLLLNRESVGGAPLSEKEAGQAFALVRTGVALAPNDPESQLLLGYALVKFGEDDLALTALERYRQLDPQGRDADQLISSIRSAQNSSSPGLQVYSASCASCHGPAGNGGLGPSLRESAMTRAAAARVIAQGQGAMPAFPEIKGENLNALLDLLEGWTAEGQGEQSGQRNPASPSAPTTGVPGAPATADNRTAGSLSGNSAGVPMPPATGSGTSTGAQSGMPTEAAPR